MFVFSQKIDGIGKFKIDKTTPSIIDNIKKETGLDCDITNVMEFYGKETNDTVLQEILLNCKNTKLYYISHYKLENINLNNVYLMFYNDELIEFRCDKNKDLDILFTRKHGRPYIQQKIYQNIVLNTLKYDEHITKYVWRYNSITVLSYESRQVFDGITREAGSYFIIFNKTYKKIIKDCDIFRDELENKMEDI